MRWPLRQAVIWPRACSVCYFLALILGLVAAAEPAVAQQEIAAFNLTDLDGSLSVGYTLTDRDVGFEHTTSSSWIEQLSATTRSYVYHPALLDMTIGGAVLFLQDDYESGPDTTGASQTLFNYDARFRFLALKSYPFSVYVRRDHPNITNGVLGRFNAPTDEYGANGVFNRVLLPITVYWNAAHSEAKGSGFGSIVDEVTSRASLRTTLPYLKTQTLRLDLDWDERQSASGNAGLPIEPSLVETLNMKLSGTNRFGEKRNLNLNQYLDVKKTDTQKTTLQEVDDLSYLANLNWQHSDVARSYANLAYRNQDRTEGWNRATQFGAGGSYQFGSGLLLSGTSHYDRNEAPETARKRIGAGSSARVSIPVWIGNLSLTGSVNFDRTDQESSSDTSDVFDETHLLTGIVPVPLNQMFVVVESVTVTNLAQTQIFVEGLDYRLVTIGSTTTIERVPSGGILDGQEVSVGYEYQTGGTAEYDTIGQSIAANYGVSNVNVYVSLYNSDNELRDGFLTTPLNDSRQFEIGGRAVYPMPSGWSLSGDYRYTRLDEDISPFIRKTYGVSVQSANFWRTNFTVGLQSEQVDYKFSTEDRDSLRYFVAVSSRFLAASTLTYRYTSGGDDGGSVVSEDERHNLQFDWRFRKVGIFLRASKSSFLTGSSVRDDLRIDARLVRGF